MGADAGATAGTVVGGADVLDDEPPITPAAISPPTAVIRAATAVIMPGRVVRNALRWVSGLVATLQSPLARTAHLHGIICRPVQRVKALRGVHRVFRLSGPFTDSA